MRIRLLQHHERRDGRLLVAMNAQYLPLSDGSRSKYLLSRPLFRADHLASGGLSIMIPWLLEKPIVLSSRKRLLQSLLGAALEGSWRVSNGSIKILRPVLSMPYKFL